MSARPAISANGLSSYRVANRNACPAGHPASCTRSGALMDECRSEEPHLTARTLICVLTPRFNAAGKVWPRRGLR